MELFDSDFGATDAFAAKESDSAFAEFDYAIFGCMNREIAADKCADARTLGGAGLADDNLAGFDLLATGHFEAESLALAIAVIFASSTCFDV
jgi:hypothetical protein